MHPHMLGLSAILALALPPAAVAQEPAEPSPAAAQAEGSQAERIESALADFDAKYSAFMKAYRAAESDEARQEIVDELLPDSAAVAAELMAAVELDPAAPAAADALAWMVERRMGAERGDALAMLAEHHATSSKAMGMLPALARSGDLAAERFTRAVLASATEPKDLANAHLTLGKILTARHANARSIADAGGETEGLFLGALEPDLIESLKALDADGLAALETEALACFEHIVNTPELAEAKNGRRTFGEEAESVLFETRYLAVGKVAPEIEGTDSAEVAFNLSDYRGQVVLLDFWGDW